MAPLLTARGLTIAIAGRNICHGLDLALSPGQRWAILGTNGCGKTTLLHTLAGFRPPAAGEILLGDKPMRSCSRKHIARHLGVLLQDSADPFPATVLETALTGRHPYYGIWEQESREDREIARTALRDMELSALEERAVNRLSGGERRRLAIATVLTQNPPVMLLDEPTNHLDLHHQIMVMRRMSGLAGDGKGIAMVLHDPNLASRYCSHVMMLFGNGEWLAGTAEDLLTETTLSRLYQHPVGVLEGAGRKVFVPE